MDTQKITLSEKYFDEVYNNNADPWNFETSEYEREKYAVTIAALPKLKYQRVFEIGCSIGVLTEMLAPKCEMLLAVDAAEAPLKKALNRLKKYSNVLIEKMDIPSAFGPDQYDLIVVSEVAYYLNDQDLSLLREKVLDHLVTGAHLLMVHWTPVVADYPQTGDEVHNYFLSLQGKSLKVLLSKRHHNYRVELFEKI